MSDSPFNYQSDHLAWETESRLIVFSCKVIKRQRPSLVNVWLLQEGSSHAPQSNKTPSNLHSNELKTCWEMHKPARNQCSITHDRSILMHNNNDYLISSLWLCSRRSLLSLERINHRTVERTIDATTDGLINKSTYWILQTNAQWKSFFLTTRMFRF